MREKGPILGHQNGHANVTRHVGERGPSVVDFQNFALTMSFLYPLPHECGFCRILSWQPGYREKGKRQNFKSDIEADENQDYLEWEFSNPSESTNTRFVAVTDIPERCVGTNSRGSLSVSFHACVLD
jgi:hypothetical protein